LGLDMVRCEEFYDKWKRVGNFCEKNPNTAGYIDRYLDELLEIREIQSEILGDSQKSNDSCVAMATDDLTERAVRPLAREKNREVKKLAVIKLTRIVEDNEKNGKKRRITAKEVEQVIKGVRAEMDIDRPVPLPVGEYDIILADPPWKYNFGETDSRDIENQYPTLELDEIKALAIPSAKESALFLWATAPKLQEALEVMSAWGFDYKTHAVWDKQKIGMGYWFRGQHELLLVGTKGNFSPPEESVRRSSVISAERTEHSAKPAVVYEIIEEMFPTGKYLELFARNTRTNWTAWGNQV